MIAIRGATTVENDTPEEIEISVGQLLNTLKQKNSLKFDDIICIMFSNTGDIHSYYPAKAARKAGYFSCALYSSLEPEIDGSLKKCIRVMVLADKNGTPEHVYLNRAVSLRKDITKRLNIAIDGPAGSGKSTISKILAKRLDILYLDTGAMYRACAFACIQSGVDCDDENAVKNLLSKVKLDVKYSNGSQITLLSDKDVSEKIRTPEISMKASKVSAYEYVRVKMVELQREIARQNSCVLDGRDIGTNVLPNAEFKFYLTASPEIRAERRTKENAMKGFSQPFDEVLKEIIQRDKQDKSRKIAPLMKAEDAIEIDTGNMTINEVADLLLKSIQGRI